MSSNLVIMIHHVLYYNYYRLVTAVYQKVAYFDFPCNVFENSCAITRPTCSLGCRSSYQKNESRSSILFWKPFLAH